MTSSNLEVQLKKYYDTTVLLAETHGIVDGMSVDLYPLEFKLQMLENLNDTLKAVEVVSEGFGGEDKVPSFTMEDATPEAAEMIAEGIFELPEPGEALSSVDSVQAVILKHGVKNAALVLASVFVQKAFGEYD